ncbi:hypothetical protein BC833DRAFT_575313 [Globomyces pollinis-pini]|nr:hypothetical protein BC833DRAFT_575313 [Globomyces pollinis-pini]
MTRKDSIIPTINIQFESEAATKAPEITEVIHRKKKSVMKSSNSFAFASFSMYRSKHLDAFFSNRYIKIAILYTHIILGVSACYIFHNNSRTDMLILNIFQVIVGILVMLYSWRILPFHIRPRKVAFLFINQIISIIVTVANIILCYGSVYKLIDLQVQCHIACSDIRDFKSQTSMSCVQENFDTCPNSTFLDFGSRMTQEKLIESILIAFVVSQVLFNNLIFTCFISNEPE